jgi:hypothetical protein
MTADGPKTSKGRTKSAHRRGGAGAGAGERLYRGAVRAFSLAFVAIGLAVLLVTLAAGGGPVSVGVLMGVAFIAVGAGRLWVGTRMGR